MAGFRTPAATYRLQFHREFTLAAAADLTPYLDDLGVSDIYASPLFKARRGSLHGYSVTNPMELNPELGSLRDFEELAAKLQAHSMGLVFDIVPNHMALSPDNPWWMEVLEDGPHSPYAIFFDINWRPPHRLLEGKVLLPILGKPYGQALESQELQLALDPGGFFIRYYDHKFPLDPRTYRHILEVALARLQADAGEESPAVIALQGIGSLISGLPARHLGSRAKIRARQRDKEIIKKNLWLLYQGSEEVKQALEAAIGFFNGRQGDPGSFDHLDRLFCAQAYRLAFWRVAQELINYRRFFSINDLIGIRIEDPQVFEAFKHGLLFDLVDAGKISGLRIDHIDGLFDPLEYIRRLQHRLAPRDQARDFYLVVEKILAPGETLPPEWSVAGTTGYDFLNLANGVFVSEEGYQELRDLYARFTGSKVDLPDLIREKKKLVMEALFGGEIENHAFHLGLLANQDRQARDIARGDLKAALVEVTACLPVYRTYIRSLTVDRRDLGYLERALAEAGRVNPYLKGLALDFLERVLRLDFPPCLSPEEKKEWLHFVRRWQQFTGAVMAKGWEDTALYIYNPLISLNEVGGSCLPAAAGDFHDFQKQRQESCPLAMNATSTHDTKRSEDVRARINVLSELPGEWAACLQRWSAANRGKKVLVRGLLAPDPNQEIFLYQTLLGAWPLEPRELPEFQARLQAYLIKTAREAMVHTRWVSPQLEHERGLLDFLNAVLEETGNREFLDDFLPMQARVAYLGALNSLSQVLLKTGAPGVPDFYQGTELWDFSLVDPDNRRPVDFGRRTGLLQELRRQEETEGKGLASRLLDSWQDGRIKLYLTYKALNFRKQNQDLFLRGDYLPLAAAGERQRNILAFARRRGKDWAIAAAGRFFADLTLSGRSPLNREAWGDGVLSLPPDAPMEWVDVLTGAALHADTSGPAPSLPLGSIFQELPVALLVRIDYH